MTALQASTDLLVGQWQDSPRLRAAVDAPLALIRDDVMPAFDAAAAMRHIDTAEGIWLDWLGGRIGIDRPATTDVAQDPRFGFDQAGQPFGQAPFRGDVANDLLFPIPDELYRRFIRARGLLVLGDGTFQTFGKAVRVIDPGATVTDLRNMSVRIVTTTEDRKWLELADESGALPRSAGVQIIYGDRGRFGFDQAGVGFEQGPFS